MAKISIVLMTYNSEKYIEQQLNSIKNQTRSIEEVIILDDASKDITASLIRQYLANNQLNWYFEINSTHLGLNSCLQKALKLTTGDYIFLYDQDNQYSLDYVQKMTDLLDHHPEIKLLSCNMEFVDDCNLSLTKSDLPEWYQFYHHLKEPLVPLDFFDLCKQNCSPSISIVLRKELLMHYTKIAGQYTISHTWLLNILASTTKGSYFCQEKLILYHVHTTQEPKINNKKSRDEIKEEYIGLRRRYALGINSEVKQSALSNNIKYLDCKIALYSKRSFHNFIGVIITSHHTYHMWKNMFKDNLEDILFLFK